MNEQRLTPMEVAAELGKPHLAPVLERIIRPAAPEGAQIVQEGYYVRTNPSKEN